MRGKKLMVWIAAIAVGFGIEAGARAFNAELMDRDLRIMEGVLKEILGNGSDDVPVVWGGSGTDVRGTHYDGYGVFFLAEGGGPHRVRVHVSADEHDVNVEEEVVETERGRTDTLTTDDLVDQQKDRVAEFLSLYAGAIRQLKPDDRITIRIRPGKTGPVFMRGHPSGARVHVSPGNVDVTTLKGHLDSLRSNLKHLKVRVEKEVNRNVTAALPRGPINVGSAALPGLVATVTKRDVDAHQGTDALKRRIKFETLPVGEATSRDIEIFAGILKSALSGPGHPMFDVSRPSGFYQTGVGAVFFVSHDAGRFVWKSGRFDFNAQDEDEDSVDALKASLLEVVGDYGRTLRKLKDGEHIVVNVKLPRGRGASGLVLKAKIDDVRDYDRGKLTLEQLGRKVTWTMK